MVTKSKRLVELLNQKIEEIEQIPGLSEAILDTIQESNMYREENKDNDLIKGILNHELNRPLANIVYINAMLRENLYSNEEEKEQLHEELEKNANQCLEGTKITLITHLSKEELKKERGHFSLEDMAINYASTISRDLEKAKIRLELKYDQHYGQDIEIFHNKGVFNNLWTTLSGNAINYAIEGTSIEQGIRIDDKTNSLIMNINNKQDGTEKRKYAGLGKGLGLKFAKKMIKNMGGKIKVGEDCSEDYVYDISQKFGYKNIKKDNQTKYKNFTVEISFPMSELSKE
jgi:signal transduction histidine kinase